MMFADRLLSFLLQSARWSARRVLTRRLTTVAIVLAASLLPLSTIQAATPAYRASGTFTAGTGTITPPYPASMAANDICLLAVESENQAIALTTANGFAQVPTWSPQSAGTAATNPASRLALFWKRTVGGDLAPLVADSGDHTTGQIHCFSGVITTGNPWDTGAGGNDGGVNDTSATIPGATTTSHETLVVLITSTSFNGTSTAQCSGWTNIDLGSLTERTDNTNTAGLGGGHCMATGTKASAGTYGTTTVTLANTSFKGAISLALKPVPVTTLGNGTDPGNSPLGPGGSATMAGAFTFQTNTGTDTISAVVVGLGAGASAGLSLVEITSDDGVTVYGSVTNPLSDTPSITLSTTTLTATTTSTQYKIRITPKSHANMPVPPGATYTATASINSWSGTNAQTGTDSAGTTVTIDNASPASATLTSGVAGNALVTLNWTTSSSSDFSRSVVLRWNGSSAGAEVPAEGTDYVVGNTIVGTLTATVVCVRTGDAASTAVSGVDGAGTGGCSATALTNGQAYTYKVFQKDALGNYDSGAAMGTFTPVAVTSFNGCESASCTPVASPLTYAKLYTKLAGTPFTLYGVALLSDGTLASSFGGNVTVDLLANINAGVSLGGNNCPVSQDATINLGTATFASGRATLSGITVSSAYRDVRMKFSCAAGVCGSAITQCSSDNFAIRPTALVLSSTDANADTTGASSSATPAFKTGAAFNLTATAVASYNGTPQIDPSKINAHSGAIQVGSLGGSFGTAAPGSGVATGNFTYSEVGYFNLAADGLYDDAFTAVDQPSDCTNDFSNTASGGKYGCKFRNTSASVFVGRFVPDHFALTAGSLIDRSDVNTGASETCASSFTYMGEDFKTSFTLEAQNSGSTTTQNYTGSHARFDLSTWANFVFSASGGTLAVGSAVPSGSWGSTVGNYGKANVTATHILTRPGSPAGPVTSLVISAQPSYTDGSVTYSLASSTAVHSGNTEQRYGRLRILNAYGSDLLPLRVPLRVEYYDGTAWLQNSADNCTNLPANTFALSNGISANTSASAVSLISGSGTVTLAKPSPAASGIVDLSVNLGTTGTTNTVSCNPTNPAATAANKPWLQFAWCSGKLDPNARVRFGSPKAPFIYLRERF